MLFSVFPELFTVYNLQFRNQLFLQNLSFKLYVLSVFFSMLDYLGENACQLYQKQKMSPMECLGRNKNTELQKECKIQVGKFKD